MTIKEYFLKCKNEFSTIILVNQILRKSRSHLHIHLVSSSPHIFHIPSVKSILPWIPMNPIPWEQMENWIFNHHPSKSNPMNLISCEQMDPKHSPKGLHWWNWGWMPWLNLTHIGTPAYMHRPRWTHLAIGPESRTRRKTTGAVFKQGHVIQHVWHHSSHYPNLMPRLCHDRALQN